MDKTTEQDRTPPAVQHPAVTDAVSPPHPATRRSETKRHVMHRVFSLQDGCQQQLGRIGVLPNQPTVRFCWRTEPRSQCPLLGHKDTVEKSLFLPAEGSGTHRPASKRVRLYCKQETYAVHNKTEGAIKIIKQSDTGGNIPPFAFIE